MKASNKQRRKIKKLLYAEVKNAADTIAVAIDGSHENLRRVWRRLGAARRTKLAEEKPERQVRISPETKAESLEPIVCKFEHVPQEAVNIIHQAVKQRNNTQNLPCAVSVHQFTDKIYRFDEASSEFVTLSYSPNYEDFSIFLEHESSILTERQERDAQGNDSETPVVSSLKSIFNQSVQSTESLSSVFPLSNNHLVKNNDSATGKSSASVGLSPNHVSSSEPLEEYEADFENEYVPNQHFKQDLTELGQRAYLSIKRSVRKYHAFGKLKSLNEYKNLMKKRVLKVCPEKKTLISQLSRVQKWKVLGHLLVFAKKDWDTTPSYESKPSEFASVASYSLPDKNQENDEKLDVNDENMAARNLIERMVLEPDSDHYYKTQEFYKKDLNELEQRAFWSTQRFLREQISRGEINSLEDYMAAMKQRVMKVDPEGKLIVSQLSRVQKWRVIGYLKGFVKKDWESEQVKREKEEKRRRSSIIPKAQNESHVSFDSDEDEMNDSADEEEYIPKGPVQEDLTNPQYSVYTSLINEIQKKKYKDLNFKTIDDLRNFLIYLLHDAERTNAGLRMTRSDKKKIIAHLKIFTPSSH